MIRIEIEYKIEASLCWDSETNIIDFQKSWCFIS